MAGWLVVASATTPVFVWNPSSSFSKNDGLFGVQLRQFPPDVVRDVVVRFVERVADEVLDRHFVIIRVVECLRMDTRVLVRCPRK